MSDYEYVNITIRNNVSNVPIPARYYETRQNNILDHPEDYDMAVVRFSIPTLGIPILYFEDGRYVVYMSYGVTTITQPVVLIPGNNHVPPGRSIYTYQEMLNMINAAILTAYNALALAEPLMPNTSAPFLCYDNTSGLFTLYGEPDWANTANTAILYFDVDTSLLFAGLYQYAIYNPPTGNVIDRFQQVFKDNKNNTETLNGTVYYAMRQDYRSLNLWSDFGSIILATSSIPVNAEFVSVTGSDGKNENRRILTDFIPNDSSSPRDITNLNYNPSGIPRYYSLSSTKEFRTLDLEILWQTKTGITIPLYINRFTEATIKLQFRKKSELLA